MDNVLVKLIYQCSTKISRQIAISEIAAIPSTKLTKYKLFRVILPCKFMISNSLYFPKRVSIPNL